MGICHQFTIFLKTQWLLLASLLGVIIGFGIGQLLKRYEVGFYWYMWLGLPGELFLNGLQLGIIPVIMTNLILVASKINPKNQGKIIGVVLGYHIPVLFSMSTIGVFLTVLIKPGVFDSSKNITMTQNSTSKVGKVELGMQEMLSDLFRNLIPENLMKSCIYTRVSKVVIRKSFNESTVIGLSTQWSQTPNLLGLMIISIIIGLICGERPNQTRALIDLCDAITIVATRFLGFIIKSMPIGVCSILIKSAYSISDMSLAQLFTKMGIFVICVLTGVAFMCLVIQPITFLIFIKKSPIKFGLSLTKPYFIAFTLTSSLLTYPIWLGAIKKYPGPPKISEQMAQLIYPLSIGIGAAGSACFIASSCIFIAQLSGTTLPLVTCFLVAILTAINVVALPSIPSASLVTVVIITKSLGISPLFVPMLFATEFILDRFRTGGNMLNISVGCALACHFTPTPAENLLDDNGDINIKIQPNGDLDLESSL